MVQSNPLCRLETADTADQRRIDALSNRFTIIIMIDDIYMMMVIQKVYDHMMMINHLYCW